MIPCASEIIELISATFTYCTGINNQPDELNHYIENHIHKNEITQEEYIHIAQQISYFDLKKLYK